MSELGKLLQERREQRGASLAEVSSKTNIREQILAVLESGDFKALPSYVHAYGFVKTYAAFLGMDFDREVKDLFHAECPKGSFGQEQVFVTAPTRKEAEVKVGYGKYVAILLVLGLVGVAGYFLFQSMSGNQPVAKAPVAKPEPKVETPVEKTPAPVVADNVTAAVTEAPVAAKEVKKPAPAPIAPVVEQEVAPKEVPAPVVFDPSPAAAEVLTTAKIVFSDVCWVHLNVDNRTDIDFIAEAGMERNVTFSDYFVIDIGNAAAVSIRYNDQTFGNFGEYRQPVKNIRFSLGENGMMTSTRVR